MAKPQKFEENVLPEKPEEVSLDETLPVPKPETKETPETQEKSKDEVEHAKIRQEIENMDLDAGLKSQVQSSVSDIHSLDKQEKIKKLLEMAKSKGVVYAIKVAKKMNDPYVLDALHDKLAKEGYYKEFLK